MIFNSVPHSQNLVDYINDVKPFRTKLIEVSEEYIIHDTVRIILDDFMNKETPKTDSAATKLIDYFTATDDSAAEFYAYYDISMNNLIINNLAETYYITHNGQSVPPLVIGQSLDTGAERSLRISMNGTADSPGTITPNSFKFSLPTGISVPFALTIIFN